MMKKHLALLLLLAASTAATHAQLKVNSLGNVYVKKTIENNDAVISIGSLPNSRLYEDNYFDIGLHVQHQGTQNTYYRVGVLGECEKSSTAVGGYAIGVWGNGDRTTDSKNIGVLGTILPSENGSGICGTEEGAPPPPFVGSYAAYFYGDTYVEGAMTVLGLYNLSDMRLKDNAQPLGRTTAKQKGILEQLQDLDVFSYTLKSPFSSEATKEAGTKAAERFAERKQRDAARRHYGVSAQELQKIFPDLVREGQDGYLTVNYTEMVPLLLQCIQELKQEVDELREKVNNCVVEEEPSMAFKFTEKQ
ncbi:MAG: tail fiber domain-containing protein [Prevotella sp.]|nr:tail fiber domain-containing protein [Prevotella sp.]